MEIPRIRPEQVADRMRRGDRVVFLDSRSTTAYQAATEEIPGSLRVPPGDVDARVSDIPRGVTMVVTYCTERAEHSSARVALRLLELGMKRAFVLTGGLAAWEQAGFPVEPLVRGDPRENAVLHQPM